MLVLYMEFYIELCCQSEIDVHFIPIVNEKIWHSLQPFWLDFL